MPTSSWYLSKARENIRWSMDVGQLMREIYLDSAASYMVDWWQMKKAGM